MNFPSFLILSLGFPALLVQANVRENGGNCEGVKSCRPRCITVRVERDVSSCGSSEGIFTVDEKINPWDIKRFQTTNCVATGTCINDSCGLDLFGDLTVRVGEEGHNGGYFYSAFDLPGDGSSDRFTFCSSYPCTKDECSLPEQMGFELQFSFFKGTVAVDDLTATPLLALELYLKAAFVGSPLQLNQDNRYGPIHLEWMDDPTGCRVDELSMYAPVAPVTNHPIWTNYTNIDPALYCEGDEYLPAALPVVEPSAQPSDIPTSSPTMSIAPTFQPTYSAIGEEQREGLRIFYNATMMSSAVSRDLHNWFTVPNYCSFTGITCDGSGFVIVLDLTNRRLGGQLPSKLDKLARLRQLKVVNNRIKGPIPEELCGLEQLTQIELGANQFSGSIPVCLHKLRHLRRLMFQYNSLAGTIPHEFCQFNELVALDISENLGMYGEIPQCMGSLPLDVLRVDNVGLVGQVPPMLCSRPSINGLSPNMYGCDAIACPAGTYEPNIGRTVNNETVCVDCEFPSNVIGSTSCRFVLNNTVISVTAAPSVATSSPTSSTTASNSRSIAPSIAPTIMPSIMPEEVVTNTTQPSVAQSDGPFPSVSPSMSPSRTLSSSPTLSPSIDPSIGPSAGPSVGPSVIPSVAPSLGTKIVAVTAVFASIKAKLNSESIETLEKATKQYLTSNSTTIDRVIVLSQSFGGASNQTRVGDRRLAESLVVDMEIEGHSTNGTFQDVIQASIVNSFDSYSSFLVATLPDLAPLVPTPAPTEIQEQAEAIVEPAKGRETNWWLLGSAVGLSIVAVLAVIFVRQSRRNREEEIRAFPVEHTAAVDGPSNPALPRDDDGDDALSEESSSGWNSTSSPGDFVNDKVVQAWSAGQNDADMYLMATQQQGRVETLV